MRQKKILPLTLAFVAIMMSACTAKQTVSNPSDFISANHNDTNQSANTPIVNTVDSFDDWKAQFRTVAIDKGYPSSLVDELLAQMHYQHKVVSLDQNQPEFSKMIWSYLDSAVAAERVHTGRQKYQQLQPYLTLLEDKYGVPGQYLIAIWGLESAYGGYTGNTNLPSALATLAFEGRRTAFAQAQLFALLDLLADETVRIEALKGSWAGGMGHTQFIPSTYRQYGVDGDGDGIRNPWNVKDALASTANYLSKSGWQMALPWGQEVILPQNFDYQWLDQSQSIEYWQRLGVTGVMDFPLTRTTAKLWLPGGHSGPAFLLYSNHEVIKVYNNSSSYALAVGLLADAIIGKPSLQQAWPREAQPLATAQVKQLQVALIELGYNPGAVDGILGKQTRRSFAQWQQANAHIADGFVSIQSTAELLP